MARITTAHAGEFAAIKHLCYHGLDSATLRERVGDRLSRHLRVSSYCFGATDPVTALPVHSVSVGLDPDAMRVFYGLVLSTPSLDFAPWLARGERVARREALVADPDRDPYLTEILVPSGLRYDVQVACASGGWSWGHMCLRRGPGEDAFAGHELRLLDALVPHLTAGLRGAATRPAGATDAEVSGTGIVVLGPDGRVELANGVAERLFREPVSGTRHSMLTAVNIVAAKLERTLADPTATGVPRLTLTEETSGVAYRLRAERLEGVDGRPRGLVVIEPAAGLADAWHLLARHGLSRREAQVALAMVRGRMNAETASELHMSIHTVQEHASRVFDKMGVRSRQELTMRLLG